MHSQYLRSTPSPCHSSLVCLQPDEEVPEGFSQQVFGSMNDQPLCSLYSPAGAEGFTGPCDPLPITCTRNSSWCHGGRNPDLDAVEELMALQFTKASDIPKCTILPVECSEDQRGAQQTDFCSCQANSSTCIC